MRHIDKLLVNDVTSGNVNSRIIPSSEAQALAMAA